METKASIKNLGWDEISIVSLDDKEGYTFLDVKHRTFTAWSKRYKVDLSLKALYHERSGVKVRQNAREMARFEKLLAANEQNLKQTKKPYDKRGV